MEHSTVCLLQRIRHIESSNTEERLLNATTAPVWRKEGYHEDYTKSPMLPDDQDDVTEYIELLAILNTPGELGRLVSYVRVV